MRKRCHANLNDIQSTHSDNRSKSDTDGVDKESKTECEENGQNHPEHNPVDKILSLRSLLSAVVKGVSTGLLQITYSQ